MVKDVYGQKANAQQVGPLMNGVTVEDKVCSEDTDTRDASFRINDGVELFNLVMTHVSLPEFSTDEKLVIANCLTRSIFNEFFLLSLDYEIYDYFKHNPDNYASLDKPVLLKKKKELIEKVKNLDMMQRIKLINRVCLEFL